MQELSKESDIYKRFMLAELPNHIIISLPSEKKCKLFKYIYPGSYDFSANDINATEFEFLFTHKIINYRTCMTIHEHNLSTYPNKVRDLIIFFKDLPKNDFDCCLELINQGKKLSRYSTLLLNNYELTLLYDVVNGQKRLFDTTQMTNIYCLMAFPDVEYDVVDLPADHITLTKESKRQLLATINRKAIIKHFCTDINRMNSVDDCRQYVKSRYYGECSDQEEKYMRAMVSLCERIILKPDILDIIKKDLVNIANIFAADMNNVSNLVASLLSREKNKIENITA